MNIQRRIALTAGATILATAGVAAPAVEAAAAVRPTATASSVSCDGWKSRRTDVFGTNSAGLKFNVCWRQVNGKSQASVAVYLWDNRKNKLAFVNVTINSWEHTFTWGNSAHHSPKMITGWHNGDVVRLDLGQY